MTRVKLPDAEKRRRKVERYTKAIIDTIIEGRSEDAKLLDLAKTPARVAKMLVDETLAYPPMPTIHLTEIDESVGDVVAVGPIGVASTCAHHLQPFTGHAWVAYLARRHLGGLSKFTRVVRACSRRLQLQERLTHQIMEELHKALKPRAILVTMTCVHGCVSCRGVLEPDMRATTSALWVDPEDMIPSIVQELYTVIDRTSRRA